MKYKTRISSPNIVDAQTHIDKEITNCGFTKYKIINCVISPYKTVSTDAGDKVISYEFNYEVEVMGFDA